MEKAVSDPVFKQPLKDDSLSVFGKYIAAELQDMHPQQMHMTKLHIQQVIEAQSQVAFQQLGSPQQSTQQTVVVSSAHHAWSSSQSELLEYYQL